MRFPLGTPWIAKADARKFPQVLPKIRKQKWSWGWTVKSQVKFSVKSQWYAEQNLARTLGNTGSHQKLVFLRQVLLFLLRFFLKKATFWSYFFCIFWVAIVCPQILGESETYSRRFFRVTRQKCVISRRHLFSSRSDFTGPGRRFSGSHVQPAGDFSGAGGCRL